jgi:hypothetical protein
MEIKIDLDMNKIDYDAINKQLQEKIAALDLKEMYDIENRVINNISGLVHDEVTYAYNAYLDRYFGSDNTTSSKGRELVESMSKAEIESKTKHIIEKFFTETYSEDVLNQVMMKMMPNIITSIIYQRVESELYNSGYDYYNRTRDMVVEEIDSALNRLRY